MPVWPQELKLSYPFGQQTEDSTIRSPKEAGYVVTRPRFTRDREIFRLRLNNQRKTLFSIYQSFLQQVRGGKLFQFTHPILGIAHTVRIQSYGEVNWDQYGWSVDLVFEEE